MRCFVIFQNLKDEWLSNVRKDVLSGIAVAFALIPEAIAFSMIAGVNPMIGLYGAFIISVIVSIFGGRLGMISGPQDPRLFLWYYWLKITEISIYLLLAF